MSCTLSVEKNSTRVNSWIEEKRWSKYMKLLLLCGKIRGEMIQDWNLWDRRDREKNELANMF